MTQTVPLPGFHVTPLGILNLDPHSHLDPRRLCVRPPPPPHPQREIEGEVSNLKSRFRQPSSTLHLLSSPHQPRRVPQHRLHSNDPPLQVHQTRLAPSQRHPRSNHLTFRSNFTPLAGHQRGLISNHRALHSRQPTLARHQRCLRLSQREFSSNRRTPDPAFI